MGESLAATSPGCPWMNVNATLVGVRTMASRSPSSDRYAPGSQATRVVGFAAAGADPESAALAIAALTPNAMRTQALIKIPRRNFIVTSSGFGAAQNFAQLDRHFA